MLHCPHPRGLDVHELKNPKCAQLATVTGALDSAKRKPGIGCDHCVDEYAPDLQLLNEPIRFRGITRPHARSQAKAALVRDAPCARASNAPQTEGPRRRGRTTLLDGRGENSRRHVVEDGRARSTSPVARHESPPMSGRVRPWQPSSRPERAIRRGSGEWQAAQRRCGRPSGRRPEARAWRS